LKRGGGGEKVRPERKLVRGLKGGKLKKTYIRKGVF